MLEQIVAVECHKIILSKQTWNINKWSLNFEGITKKMQIWKQGFVYYLLISR